MVGFLRNWVLEIVGVTVFTTMLQIIIPNNTMKKYINMIIGLLIILVIINPFIKIINKNIDIDETVFANISVRNRMSKNANNEDLINLQQKQIIKLYEEKLATEMKDLIEMKTNYSVSNMELEMVDDINDSEFGKVNSVLIEVNEIKNNKDNSINVEKVETIHVTSNNKNDINNKAVIEASAINEILIERYGLSEDNIKIYINKK